MLDPTLQEVIWKAIIQRWSIIKKCPHLSCSSPPKAFQQYHLMAIHWLVNHIKYDLTERQIYPCFAGANSDNPCMRVFPSAFELKKHCRREHERPSPRAFEQWLVGYEAILDDMKRERDGERKIK